MKLKRRGCIGLFDFDLISCLLSKKGIWYMGKVFVNRYESSLGWRVLWRVKFPIKYIATVYKKLKRVLFCFFPILQFFLERKKNKTQRNNLSKRTKNKVFYSKNVYSTNISINEYCFYVLLKQTFFLCFITLLRYLLYCWTYLPRNIIRPLWHFSYSFNISIENVYNFKK